MPAPPAPQNKSRSLRRGLTRCARWGWRGGRSPGHRLAQSCTRMPRHRAPPPASMRLYEAGRDRAVPRVDARAVAAHRAEALTRPVMVHDERPLTEHGQQGAWPSRIRANPHLLVLLSTTPAPGPQVERRTRIPSQQEQVLPRERDRFLTGRDRLLTRRTTPRQQRHLALEPDHRGLSLQHRGVRQTRGQLTAGHTHGVVLRENNPRHVLLRVHQHRPHRATTHRHGAHPERPPTPRLR
jgi:hypothetical protein